MASGSRKRARNTATTDQPAQGRSRPPTTASHDARSSSQFPFLRKRWFSNSGNTCFDDSFVFVFTTAFHNVQLHPHASDPDYVRTLYNCCTALTKYWLHGKHPDFVRANTLRLRIRTQLQQHVAAHPRHASLADSLIEGVFVGMCNWLDAFALEMPRTSSFNSLCVASIEATKRCTHGHVTRTHVMGSTSLHTVGHMKRHGRSASIGSSEPSDILPWYINSGCMLPTEINEIFHDQGHFEGCSSSCKAPSIVKWRWLSAPAVLVVCMGGTHNNMLQVALSDGSVEYFSAPYRMSLLGIEYIFVGMIQNMSNTHFRSVTRLCDDWFVYDDIHGIEQVAKERCCYDKSWVHSLHIFQRVDKNVRGIHVETPCKLSSLSVKSVQTMIETNERVQTLQGLVMKIKALFQGSKADKASAMTSLMSDYHLSKSAIQNSVLAKEDVFVKCVEKQALLMLMARELYQLYQDSEKRARD